MYQNYIFDLYGTLLDIHTDEYSKNFFKKYAKWLRKQGYAFEWKQFHDWFVKIEKWHRSQPSSHTKPEIQIEDVFREVFAGKGYVFNGLTHDSFVVEYQLKDDCMSHDLYEDIKTTGWSARTLTIKDMLKQVEADLGEVHL